MAAKHISELTDAELKQEIKKMKSTAILNATLVGFLAGIVIFSVMKSTLGFLTLIPLFFAYKLINNARYDKKELEALLKERSAR